jgi:hypothetical protein
MRLQQHAPVAMGVLLAVALSGCSALKPAAEGGVKVTDIDVGRSLTAGKAIAETTDAFRPADTFYVSVTTGGSSATATLVARWTYEDGQVVDESRQDVVATGNATVTEFHLSKPNGWPAGGYKVEVLLNGTSAGTRDFKVT